MDLQFLNIDQSDMTDAEIEEILEQEKESNKAAFLMMFFILISFENDCQKYKKIILWL